MSHNSIIRVYKYNSNYYKNFRNNKSKHSTQQLNNSTYLLYLKQTFVQTSNYQ
jgi:hypothetical protein